MQNPSADVASYARFAKRDLDKMSWLAPLALHGAINLFLGLFSKPRSHWIGKIVAGLLMLACAALIATRWPLSGERLLGEAVGLSLLAGGVATIWLSWKTRASGVA